MNRRTMLKEMSAITVGAAIRKYSRAEAPHLRRDVDLERARHESHRKGLAWRPQLAGRGSRPGFRRGAKLFTRVAWPCLLKFRKMPQSGM